MKDGRVGWFDVPGFGLCFGQWELLIGRLDSWLTPSSSAALLPLLRSELPFSASAKGPPARVPSPTDGRPRVPQRPPRNQHHPVILWAKTLNKPRV